VSAKITIVAALAFVASTVVLAEDTAPPCKGAPTIVDTCFTVHGRLGVYNGIPIRIWVAGTKRMLGVKDATGGGITVRPDIQTLLSQGEPGATVVYGDYEVCPLSKSHAGWMQFVCIESAAHLEARRRTD
jgi:hypothetical protein